MQNNRIVSYIQDLYQTKDFIPLHAPTFAGKEKEYVLETIESTFVSSVGKFVDQFEVAIESYTSIAKAVATVNGTSALQTALYLTGVRNNDLVITQALTFVATCNSIYHLGADPIFVDVSLETLGLCPKAVESYLYENAEIVGNECLHKDSKRKIKAVMPMHTFGHPVDLDGLLAVCNKWGLTLVEDAAESLGSYYKGKHTGTLGRFSALSFNGNKIITTGGGGMLLCKSEQDGMKAKHITTTAKVPHAYEFFHDEPAFNYRMPNINAALGCAQMNSLNLFLTQKRQIANAYEAFFKDSEYKFITQPKECESNYWLNAVLCESFSARESLLKLTNEAGVMTRPIWQLMHKLPMFKSAYRDALTNSIYLEARLVNIPSTPVDVNND